MQVVQSSKEIQNVNVVSCRWNKHYHDLAYRMLRFIFYASDLEMEIHRGAIQIEDPDSTCLVLLRNIVDLRNYVNHPAIGDYLVTSYNERDEKVGREI